MKVIYCYCESCKNHDDDDNICKLDAVTISDRDLTAARLNYLIFDINPAEICTHIQKDNLKEWCAIMQIGMKMAMAQLPGWAKEGADA